MFNIGRIWKKILLRFQIQLNTMVGEIPRKNTMYFKIPPHNILIYTSRDRI